MTQTNAHYRIENLVMVYGGYTALDNVSFEIGKGELLVLLGPSGCGKSTAMRCISGLEKPTSGRITLGNRVVFDDARKIDLAPEKRDIGMVFQSYALWPHKTVRDNIAYPLQVRRMRQAQSEGWVEAAARMVDCEGLLDRYPGQLSGGQQQRVALARGIVFRPDLVMFDEPLSNLDALLREKVRNDLAALHRRLGFAGIYVTHDQSEAFAIGDRVAVMHRGGISQIGSPQTIFERPENDYVANFVGMGNVIPLAADGDGWRGPDGSLLALDAPVGRSEGVTLRFRTASARLLDAAEGGAGLCLQGRFEDAVYAGGEYEVVVSIGTGRVLCRAETAQVARLAQGDAVTVGIAPGKWSLFRDGRAVLHGGSPRDGAGQ